MMTGETLLRQLIREEIGRSFMRGERIDFYPWHTENTNVSIIRDAESEGFWVFVEELTGDSSEGKIHKKRLPSEEEAQHWARQVIDDLQRKEFTRGHKK